MCFYRYQRDMPCTRIPFESPRLQSTASPTSRRCWSGDWHHLNFSRVLVQHPGMYRVFLPFLDKLIRGSALPPRDREILCIRTLALGGDVYETHHHVTIARKAGMTEAEIEAARTGGAGLSQFDQCLVRAAEELVREQCVSDPTWGLPRDATRGSRRWRSYFWWAAHRHGHDYAKLRDASGQGPRSSSAPRETARIHLDSPRDLKSRAGVRRP